MMTSETNNAPQELQSFWRRLRHTPVRDLLWRRQLTGRMDVEAILTSFALPASCADVVRRVVKKARLWRLEKAELTSELAAHFRDGLQEGLSETDLIRDFGDPAKAAKLIRRAKVRCRPMLWHIARGVVRAVAVFVLLYFVLVGYYALGKPEIKVNYLRQLNAAAEKVAPEDRAWPLYREAALQLNPVHPRYEPESPVNQIFMAARDSKPLSRESQQFLRDHAATIALIRQGAAKPGLGYVHRFGKGPDDFPGTANGRFAENAPIIIDPNAKNEPIIGVLLPCLGTLTTLSRILVADAQIATSENDLPRVLSDLQAIDGIAHQCFESPFYMNTLVGYSICHLQLFAFNDLFTQYTERFTNANLQDYAHHLAKWNYREPTMRTLKGERKSFEDLVQRIYSDDGHGNGKVTATGLGTLMNLDEVFGKLPRAPIKEMHHSTLDTLKYHAQMTLHQNRDWLLSPTTTLSMPVLREVIADRQDMMSRFDAMMQHSETLLSLKKRDVQAYEAQHPSPWKTIEQDKFRYLMVRMVVPDLDSLAWTCERMEVSRDGVLLGIALELFHRKEGRYPETLAELSPKYMAEIPVDPMNGEPLKYRVTENGPLVYSVGTNHKDDGGKPTQEVWNGQNWLSNSAEREQPQYQGDWVLWPMPQN
jgi:hypothetical protein